MAAIKKRGSLVTYDKKKQDNINSKAREKKRRKK